MNPRFGSAFALLVLSVGCAPKKISSTLPNLDIPVQCVEKVTGKQCDTTVEPPKCHSMVVRYSPPNCPVIEVKQ